jgi:DNA-binding IclR family transcriptional regulator
MKSIASHLVKPVPETAPLTVKPAAETARLTHQSLERGLRILETVALNGGTTTLAETVRRTALHRSTAHHLLQTLVSFGYLHQDRQTRGYELTAKLFRLTARVWTPEQIGRIAEPVTQELTEQTGEGSSVATFTNGTITIVAKCDPGNPFRIVEEIGKPRPIHATAVGKAIVAFLPSAERTAIAARLSYERYTPRTIANREDFEAEMLRIQAAGYAVDDEEHHEGVRCMAAPIFSYAGHVVACLCVLGPKFRMTRRKLRELRVPLLERAKSLSTRLGWNDDIPPPRTN